MSSAKRIIVGLGNPGKKYTYTRHNAGALLLAKLLKHFDLKLKKQTELLSETVQMLWELPPSLGRVEKTDRAEQEAESALPSKEGIQKVQLLLLRPQSYMNLSGRAVQRALQSCQVKAQEVLVLHDETELPFGEVRFKQGGGHRGHNGLRDISALIGPDFGRLRLGVGRPEHKADLADYVLSDFSQTEQEQFPALFERGQEMCQSWLAGAASF